MDVQIAPKECCCSGKADESLCSSYCLSAIIAALYAALTLLLAPISYGPVQLRLSEAFTVLPMVLPQSIPGLFVGCLIANIFNPSPSIFDIVFGSLTTLLAAYGTYKLRNKPILAAACPERGMIHTISPPENSAKTIHPVL